MIDAEHRLEVREAEPFLPARHHEGVAGLIQSRQRRERNPSGQEHARRDPEVLGHRGHALPVVTGPGHHELSVRTFLKNGRQNPDQSVVPLLALATVHAPNQEQHPVTQWSDFRVGRLEPQTADRETVGIQQDTSQRGGADTSQVMMPKGEPNFLYSNRSYWYPQALVSDFATARMYITVPNPYVCVASGELLPKSPVFVNAMGSQPGKMYMFKAERPLRYLSFIVSRFERSEGPTVVLDERVRPAPRSVSEPSR